MYKNIIKVRKFVPTDIKTLAQWAAARLFVLTENDLPERGVIVNDCLAGFCYPMSKTAWGIDWVISDPSYGKIEQELSNALIHELCTIAKAEGAQRIVGSSKQQVFEGTGKALGFTMEPQHTFYQKELV